MKDQISLYHTKSVAVYGKLPGTNTPRRRSEESFHLLSCVSGEGRSVRINADTEEFPEADMPARLKIHDSSRFYDQVEPSVFIEYFNNILKPFGYVIQVSRG